MCPAKAYPCPCCGYKTITKEPPGSYEICPICFWEDSTPDGSARFYTSNKITLIQAQRNFLSFGACAREWLTDVRPPTEEERRESDWQPIELRVHRQWHELLDCFKPSDTRLWHWLRFRVNDGMLQEIIFSANYGGPGLDYEEDMQFLKRIRDESWEYDKNLLWRLRKPGKKERKTKAPIKSYSLSVLEGALYFEPEKIPNELQIHGHLKRAFGCAVLIRNYNKPQNQSFFDETYIIIQLIASVLHLDKETWALTLQLLTWRILSMPADYEECPFFFMGVLLIAAMLYRSEAEGFLLHQLGEMVLSEEKRIREILAEYFSRTSPEFLFGLKNNRCVGIDKWKKITQQVLINPPNPHPRKAASILQDIGMRVVGGNYIK